MQSLHLRDRIFWACIHTGAALLRVGTAAKFSLVWFAACASASQFLYHDGFWHAIQDVIKKRSNTPFTAIELTSSARLCIITSVRTNVQKVSGSRTFRHQRKFLKCNGAKAQKADYQDVIRFTPLFGLMIYQDVFFRSQMPRNTSPVKCNTPLPVQERVSRIRFEFLVKK